MNLLSWIKRNKELSICWGIGIAIVTIFLSVPKRYIFYYRGHRLLSDSNNTNAFPELRWEVIIPLCVSILVLGVLMIYTIRNQKKN